MSPPSIFTGNKFQKPQTWFITGTDTGVGKTVLTSLLLATLLEQGVNALALKPFCTGSLGDVNLLFGLQNRLLPKSTINPYFFEEPLAPLVAASLNNKSIRLADVLRHINTIRPQCDLLLIEGAGGLLTPLGRDFSALDLIHGLSAKVIVASRNELGALNRTILVHRALQSASIPMAAVVLMGAPRPDLSVRSNARVLRKCSKGSFVIEIPYLGSAIKSVRHIKSAACTHRNLLSRLLRTIAH